MGGKEGFIGWSVSLGRSSRRLTVNSPSISAMTMSPCGEIRLYRPPLSHRCWGPMSVIDWPRGAYKKRGCRTHYALFRWGLIPFQHSPVRDWESQPDRFRGKWCSYRDGIAGNLYKVSMSWHLCFYCLYIQYYRVDACQSNDAMVSFLYSADIRKILPKQGLLQVARSIAVSSCNQKCTFPQFCQRSKSYRSLLQKFSVLYFWTENQKRFHSLKQSPFHY